MTEIVEQVTDVIERVGWLRLDLHTHTNASRDSILSPDRLLEAAWKRGLDGIAVTDHDTMAGVEAVAAAAPDDFLVIAGEEVKTLQGELLGLFLQEEVPGGLEALETAQRIRAQGGLVGVPHPTDRMRQHLLPETLDALHRVGLIDFIEGLNGRSFRRRYNQRAQALGERLGLPLSAGSDAHSAGEVGTCLVYLPPFEGPQKFLAALAEGELEGRRSRFWIKFTSLGARLWRWLRRK